MTDADPGSFTATGHRAARADLDAGIAVPASEAHRRALEYRRTGHRDAAAYWTAYAETIGALEADR